METKNPDKNKVSIHLKTFYKSIDNLEKDKTIYILCGSENRSTTAVPVEMEYRSDDMKKNKKKDTRPYYRNMVPVDTKAGSIKNAIIGGLLFGIGFGLFCFISL
jgi:hypothetical protein